MSTKHTFWSEHIQGWQTSGQTQRTYCREHGLSLPSFGYWRRKLRADASAANGLIPIVATPIASRPDAVIEIALANRLSLRVAMDTAPSALVPWIKALTAC